MGTDIEIVEYSDYDRKLANLSGTSSKIVSTVKAESFEDKLDIANAVLNAVSLQEEMLDKPFDLVNWIGQVIKIKPEEIDSDDDRPVDENGMVPALRLVLLAADGSAYATTSESVASALGNIAAILGEPSTWNKPVRVVVRRVKGSGARYFMALSIIKTK